MQWLPCCSLAGSEGATAGSVDKDRCSKTRAPRPAAKHGTAGSRYGDGNEQQNESMHAAFPAEHHYPKRGMCKHFEPDDRHGYLVVPLAQELVHQQIERKTAEARIGEPSQWRRTNSNTLERPPIWTHRLNISQNGCDCGLKVRRLPAFFLEATGMTPKDCETAQC